ncbi:DUF2570 domain-containing protein [Salmonella enterica subsp. enterica]|nr:DUF2570 domain-containing protein [Salmonella enterica subsp. enterica serovar Aba]EEL9956399.1 DUF2570 domain-containing protein [Salmonella enterica subsp. enterica serovar Aba]EHQ0138328.1 DUF2570 domain-containing protein [Salmonella enterica subsp. enterica serovar Aba]EHX6402492.1 DUF2570 domain-containing protein [Salmonella enterica subsp. enterica serovar Aba]
MRIHYKIIIFAFALSVLGGIVWSASHYHDKYQAERLRADAAEQNANAAEAITANVIQFVNIINAISEANQDAKNQITLESQGAQADIKVAIANDDCANRPVPPAAADRLRQFADSLRTGSGSASTGKPDS